MSIYPVKFKTRPDPSHPGGYILQFAAVGDITDVENPLFVAFPDQLKLQSAFLKAGLYLHSFGTEDTGRHVMPDPDRDYEVSDQMLRDLGFDLPSLP